MEILDKPFMLRHISRCIRKKTLQLALLPGNLIVIPAPKVPCEEIIQYFDPNPIVPSLPPPPPPPSPSQSEKKEKGNGVMENAGNLHMAQKRTEFCKVLGLLRMLQELLDISDNAEEAKDLSIGWF